MNTTPLIMLASASPRRRELLDQLGVRFTVAPANIDETMCEGESPQQFVVRMAREKALAGFKQGLGLMPVLGSDTIVVLDGRVLGKPASRAEAESMLLDLSGQTHHVYSAVAVIVEQERILETINITAVTFGDMPGEWVREYCQGEEPMDKAGAYAVQGGAGQYISRIEGSYTGVMGLPLFETAQLLRQGGLLE